MRLAPSQGVPRWGGGIEARHGEDTARHDRPADDARPAPVARPVAAMDVLFPRFAIVLLVLSCWLAAAPAVAADPCLKLPSQAAHATDVPARVAAAACEEHRLWYRPFIDVD